MVKISKALHEEQMPNSILISMKLGGKLYVKGATLRNVDEKTDLSKDEELEKVLDSIGIAMKFLWRSAERTTISKVANRTTDWMIRRVKRMQIDEVDK